MYMYVLYNMYLVYNYATYTYITIRLRVIVTNLHTGSKRKFLHLVPNQLSNSCAMWHADILLYSVLTRIE